MVAFCQDCKAEFTEWISDTKECPECEGKIVFKDILFTE